MISTFYFELSKRPFFYGKAYTCINNGCLRTSIVPNDKTVLVVELNWYCDTHPYMTGFRSMYVIAFVALDFFIYLLLIITRLNFIHIKFSKQILSGD